MASAPSSGPPARDPGRALPQPLLCTKSGCAFAHKSMKSRIPTRILPTTLKHSKLLQSPQVSARVKALIKELEGLDTNTLTTLISDGGGDADDCASPAAALR